MAPKAKVFAAAIPMHCAREGVASPSRVVHHGGGMSVVGRWHISGGFEFGPYLVDDWQCGVASIWGGGVKPKVSLLAKPVELQYYFAPFQRQRSEK